MTKLICCLVGDKLTVKVLEREIPVEVEAQFGAGCFHKFEKADTEKGGLYRLQTGWIWNDAVQRFGDIWIAEIEDLNAGELLEQSIQLSKENSRLAEIIRRLENLEDRV